MCATAIFWEYCAKSWKSVVQHSKREASCSRGRDGFQCGEDVFPNDHAQCTIEILQLPFFLASLVFWLILASMVFEIVGQSVSDTGRPGQKWWKTDFFPSLLPFLWLLLINRISVLIFNVFNVFSLVECSIYNVAFNILHLLVA